MTTLFPEAPTYADPIIVDERTKKARFNPIWLRWFLQVAQLFSESGGGGGAFEHNLLSGLQGGTTDEYYHLPEGNSGGIPYYSAVGALASSATFGTDEVLLGGGIGAAPTSSSNLTFDGTTLATTGLDNSGDTVLGDSSGDVLTINAGTWTYASNYTATRAIGTAAAGATVVQTNATTYSGDSGGTTDIRAYRLHLTSSGSNNLVRSRAMEVLATHAGSGTLTTLDAIVYSAAATSTGNVTTSRGVVGQVTSEAANVVTNGYAFNAVSPAISGGGAITTAVGLQVNAQGNASITNAIGVNVEDFSNSTNMYGVRLQLSSGTGKYNIYADGTADNVFRGNVRIGSTTAPTTALDVTGTINSTAYQVGGAAGVDFSGAITNLTIVKGIVIAAS